MNESRKYRYADARLLELAAIIQTHFNSREALFQVHDPNVSVVWLQEKLEATRTLSIDDFERGLLARRTEDLLAIMQECHQLVRRLRYYVGQAFDTRQSIKREFRLLSYNKKRKRQANFILWMQSFVETVIKYREDLQAAGAPPALIDDLKSGVGELGRLNLVQEIRKGIRSNHTQERIENLNMLYDALKRIEKLAYFVYPNEERDLAFFLLPSVSYGSEEGEAEDGNLRPIDGYTPESNSSTEDGSSADPDAETDPDLETEV